MKIKKCPFCGASPDIENEIIYIEKGDITKKPYYSYVHFCSKYSGVQGMTVSIHGDTKREVVNLWNKRGK